MTLSDLLYKLFFPRPTYGIWIPDVGWLRNSENKVYVDNSKRVARAIAKRLGYGARVEYIETVTSDPLVEKKLLSVEKDG